MKVGKIIYLMWTQIINFTDSRVGNQPFCSLPFLRPESRFLLLPTHLPSGRAPFCHLRPLDNSLLSTLGLILISSSSSAVAAAFTLLAFTRRVKRWGSQNIPSFSSCGATVSHQLCPSIRYHVCRNASRTEILFVD